MAKWSDIKAALEGDDEDAKATAYATIAAAFPCDDDGDGDKSKEKDADDAPDTKKDAADDADKKDSADDAPDSKKDTAAVAASAVVTGDAALRVALSRIDTLEKKASADERKSLIAGREMSKQLAETLGKSPIDFVRSVCAGLPPKAKKDLAAAAKVEATRGDTQGGTASRLPPAEKAEMDQRMGVTRREASIKHDGKTSTFEVLTSEDAKRHLDTKKGGK